MTRICVMHDIEESVDTPVSNSLCRENLRRMLAVERQHGVRGTYNILGQIYTRVGPDIASDGHAVGFHSYNHDIADCRQLSKVRKIDALIKGYRPPQSHITNELTPRNLSHWNFEWLASSNDSLGSNDCFEEQGVAYIPIDTDDYEIYTGAMSYEQWRNYLLDQIANRDFYAFSVHDCYANLWIDQYAELLASISELGEFKTCQQIANQLFTETRDGHTGTRG